MHEVSLPLPDRVHERRWWTLVCLCLCLMVIGVDNTILNVALPTIVRDLKASGSELQWIVDSYTIVFACLLLTAGAIGDRFGRRRALMLGVAWFGACSGFASFAQSPTQLVIARGLMGVGGAFIFPTTLSILTTIFRDPAERARAIGVWAGVSAIGIAAGPLLGGILVEHFGWSSVFLVNVPLCTLGLVGAWFLVPGGLRHRGNPLDPIGGLLSISALIALLFAIIDAPDHGWTSPGVLAGFAIAVFMLAAFIKWETHTPAPMLDVRFFANPRFSAASATITLTQFSLFGSTFLLTQYFQFALGYSPLKAGMMLTPVALGLMVGAPTAPRIVVRHGTKRVVMGGLSIVAVALACCGSDSIMSNFGLGLLVRWFYGLGIGFTQAPVTESIMGSVPPSRAGVGSAVNDTTRQTGGALGVAVLGSIFAARFHSVIGYVPGVPNDAARAARESIGSAQQAATTLPTAQGESVRDAAHHAFLSSMRLTYTIAVLVVVAAIAIAYRYLPARPALAQHTSAVAERDNVNVDMPIDWTPASPPATSTTNESGDSATGIDPPASTRPRSSRRRNVASRL
jgi:EmrB/QacA subfamily drug resistance transporter